jgi:hypothetical protein
LAQAQPFASFAVCVTPERVACFSYGILLGFTGGFRRFPVCFLRVLECAPGVVERLPRVLVCCQMVLLTVMLGGHLVRVRSQFVHLGGHSMEVARHTRFPPQPAYTSAWRRQQFTEI